MASRRFLLAGALILASCGGGDVSPTDSGLVAYYGTYGFRGSRLLALIVFEGGLVYGFYQSDFTSAIFPEFAYAGFFVGESSSPGEAKATYRGYDYDFERKTTYPSVVTLEVSPARLDGLLKDAGRDDDTFAAYSFAETSTTPTIPRTLRDYDGYIRTVNQSMSIQASLSVAGVFSLSDGAGCTVRGNLAPRPIGNLLDAEATFSASCAAPAGRYTGHALQAFNANNVYVMLTKEGLTGGVFIQLFAPR